MAILSTELRARVTPFVRYCIIGAGNTVLDFGIYTALTRTWIFWRTYFLLANALSFVIVVTWSFFWNRRWTFQNHAPQVAEQYIRFIVTTVVGLGISEAVLLTGVRLFHLPDLLAKLIAGPLVVLWNFTMYRLWAFRRSGVGR